MRRSSIPRWIALVAISLTVVFLFSAIAHDQIALAAKDRGKPQTQGALQVLDKDGRTTAECPLKHTAVSAKVSGFISRVTVTQEFENNLPNKIEAVYTFPLPQAAAVDDLTMLIGQRTVKGKIMRREDAQNAYAAAKQLGKVASLLDQERPNIFTQQVANIMPGERVRIVISYVETLKYEDGSYEWSFPMVVGPRYIPAGEPAEQIEQSSPNPQNDASRISPGSAPAGMRAGHDISLEIDLDAGVPLVGVNSESHETEIDQLSERRAVVRLKDRATIPNKDFLLSYRVAGAEINDAVLAHRSERGGFFTLILQPPQRVAAEDVMPREMVFVLDTSGSMEGFPLEKAKETMKLALNTLYPHDTFNLITFAGGTDILFPEPVFATPENLRLARTFLSQRHAAGGTEMMTAIKAAFKSSDHQDHLSLVCFMTDGQVGNDFEILAEVQKHENARVFSMGFGSSPNRFLLDRMAEYGRGEVDYVSETGDTSAVAKRFNDRIRYPLLTDVSIDWSGLPVTDVYPKRIPDLFSVKPVIVTGRYASASTGTIRLKGNQAGQSVVREIAVNFPESEAAHDVLATLWGRRKIDELMREESAGASDPALRDQKREEITQVGLTFKLMTQYTSFVAIDEVVFTGPGEPERVNVPVEPYPGSISSGIAQVVMVTSSGSTLQSTSSSLGSTITTLSIADLPLQGRSFSGLLELTPGATATQPDQLSQVNLAFDGQRPTSNSFMVDGVSANFGATTGAASGQTASGNVPALTASGGANSLATMDSIQELRIESTVVEAELGGVAGAQVSVISNSGSNNFHGSIFHFFGNDVFDANDWFANSRGLQQPPKRLNSFGGSLGGPMAKDQTFFFASYEGMRLRQPMVGLTNVPSLTSRIEATGLQPYLAAFPVSSGIARSDGFAEFAASFANAARHDIGSLTIDHMLNPRTSLRGRYSFADSDATQRGPDGFSLNTVNLRRTRSQTLTGFLSHTLSPSAVLEVRANYGRLLTHGEYHIDQFGGALISGIPSSSFAFDLNSRNAGWSIGADQSTLQRQFNLVGALSLVRGTHTFKLGGDYRRISPRLSLRDAEANILFDGVSQALTGIAARANSLSYNGPQNPVFNRLGLYAQDEWRIVDRVTMSYGLRWELAPPPSTNLKNELAVDQVENPASLKLAAPGSALWQTTLLNFAPRAGLSYRLSDRLNRELVLRGNAGILYDLGQDSSGEIFTDSIPFVSGSATFNSPFTPTAVTGGGLPLVAFDPQLKLPYVIKWNVSIQQSLGPNQVVSAEYLGSSGKRLLHTATFLDQNPQFGFLRLTTNRGNSDYRALQIMFERRAGNGIAAMASYTWSQSRDNVSIDSVRRVVMSSLDPASDRGPSDFDIRHQLKGYLVYELPSPFAFGLGNKVFRNWETDLVFNARSARALNVVYLVPTAVGVAYLRPNVVGGTPPYILDSNVAGNRLLNSAAFLQTAGLQQGNLPRNGLRGFPLYQVDLALRRRFHFSERVSLQVQADAFNLLNQANFEDPLGNDLVFGSKLSGGDSFSQNQSFGQSTSMTGRSLTGGGFPSFYGLGGSRSLRFSVKLRF